MTHSLQCVGVCMFMFYLSRTCVSLCGRWSSGTHRFANSQCSSQSNIFQRLFQLLLLLLCDMDLGIPLAIRGPDLLKVFLSTSPITSNAILAQSSIGDRCNTQREAEKHTAIRRL
jgi:hypothetical protein